MVELTWFGPDDADALEEWRGVVNAVRAVDAPWRHPVTPRGARARLRYGWDLEPARRVLLHDDAGSAVAVGSLGTSERDNLHVAVLGVEVHPRHRRLGHGSWLLDALEAEARSNGRTSGLGSGDDVPSTRAFASRHRYERLSAFATRRQHLDRLDRAHLARLLDDAATRGADYRVERWPVPTDPDRLDDLAAMAAAMNDAPTDDLDVEDEVFDAERMAGYETAQRGHGQRLHRLVAVHRPTGDLAGHTVVAIDEERPHLADQHDTVVAPPHRGHRLGLLLKAEMLRLLLEVEPQVRTIDTGNAVSNDHMIAVNEALGYELLGVEAMFQRSL